MRYQYNRTLDQLLLVAGNIQVGKTKKALQAVSSMMEEDAATVGRDLAALEHMQSVAKAKDTLDAANVGEEAERDNKGQKKWKKKWGGEKKGRDKKFEKMDKKWGKEKAKVKASKKKAKTKASKKKKAKSTASADMKVTQEASRRAIETRLASLR